MRDWVSMARRINVQTMFPKYFIAPGHSEYRDFWVMKKLEDSYPLKFHLLDAHVATVIANATYAWESVMYKSRFTRGLVLSRFWRGVRRAAVVPQRYWAKVQADVILTRSSVPINKVDLPIVFEADFYPYGIPSVKEEVRKLLYVPRWIIERCAFVSVRHDLSAKTFKALFPDFAHKAVVIPHYLPYLEALPEESIIQKFNATRGAVKMLFVGNLAKLKGLVELVQAYTMLREKHVDIEFTVVSRFDDGPVELPAEVKKLSNIPHREVYRLMAESHIFAMPANKEATGAVYWEAMANGCAILGPDISPQKELFGEFGLTADPLSPEDIAQALGEMADDRDFCLSCALKARKTFLERYHHSVVARKYFELFQRAVAEGQGT